MPAATIQARREALQKAHPRYRHWEVFLTVEDDLKNISRYVDICEDNYNTYSIELASLIMRSCSEIEKLAKRISGAPKRCEFKDFMVPIYTMYPEFASFGASFPLWDITLTPWEKLQEKDPVPLWWSQYNKIKHDEEMARQAGNLCNALHSVSALYILVLYYERFIYAGNSGTSAIITIGPRIESRYLIPTSSHIRYEQKQIECSGSSWRYDFILKWIAEPAYAR